MKNEKTGRKNQSIEKRNLYNIWIVKTNYLMMREKVKKC